MNIFQNKNIIFFGYARTALEYCFNLLDLKNNDEVLYPDYICDVLIPPAKKRKIKIKFYRTKNNLEPDLSHALALINKKTKAFLGVNYFGFPQPFEKIKLFCEKNSLVFIEDNAHSFLSKYEGKRLGNFGDVSITSFRKLVPLVNGAALKSNLSIDLKLLTDKIKKNSLMQENSLKKELKSFIHRKLMLGGFNLSNYINKKKHIPKHGNTEHEELPYAIHKSSLHILNKLPHKEIIKIKRNNFYRILSYSNKRLVPIFDTLDEGIVPTGCAFLTSDRDKWIKSLSSKGEEVNTWPSLPSSVCNKKSNALRLWSEIIVVNT